LFWAWRLIVHDDSRRVIEFGAGRTAPVVLADCISLSRQLGGLGAVRPP
jgi:hypothetical protein